MNNEAGVPHLVILYKSCDHDDCALEQLSLIGG